MLKILVLSSVLFASCTVHRILSVSDGSKADGTLTFSYQAFALQKVIINWDKAQADANERCKQWGYSKANFFDSGFRTCLDQDCTSYRVVYKCQCVN